MGLGHFGDPLFRRSFTLIEWRDSLNLHLESNQVDLLRRLNLQESGIEGLQLQKLLLTILFLSSLIFSSHERMNRLARVQHQLRRIMTNTPKSSVNFSLNPRLELETPSPPVPLAASWAKSFPLKTSPFHQSNPSASNQSAPSDINSKHLLNLAQGVPGHNPPPALISKMKDEFESPPPAVTHGYMQVFGEPKLREALSEDLRQIYGAEKERLNADNVAITSGANLAFAVVSQALAKDGDSAVLPTPWVSFQDK